MVRNEQMQSRSEQYNFTTRSHGGVASPPGSVNGFILRPWETDVGPGEPDCLVYIVYAIPESAASSDSALPLPKQFAVECVSAEAPFDGVLEVAQPVAFVSPSTMSRRVPRYDHRWYRCAD